MNKLIRQTHRWLGMSLIVLTIVNAVAFALGYAIPALYYLPLLPLFLLMGTGLCMFMRPYFTRRDA